MKTTEYDIQAANFLSATQATITSRFIEHGKHFQDDKEDRDIYEITLQRGTRKYVFKFGQSIANSGKYIVKDFNPKMVKVFNDKVAAHSYAGRIGNYFNVLPNPNQKPPSSYDVLTCLTKSDPGDFENFCSEYGYDTDSRKAKKTYKAVRDEWYNVSKLFSDTEIEQLQEIQ